MPPNQDDGPDTSSSLPTLSDNPSQPLGIVPPEQITPTSPPPTQPVAETTPNNTTAPREPLIIHSISQSPITTANPQPTVSQNNPPTISTPASSHIFRNLFLFLIFFLITASGVSLALAYNNYPFYKPPKAIQKTLDNFIAISPIPKPTRIILNSTVARSATLKSANQKTEFTFSTSAKNFPISSVKLGISGPIEFKVQEKQAAEADINLEVKFEGAAFTGSASFKKIDNTVFFKANEIPFGQFYQQLLDYKNKWYFYKIPADYLPKKDDADTYAKVTKVVMDFVDKSQAWTKVTSQDGNVYTMELTPPKKELDNLMFNLVAAAEPKDQKQILTDVEKENFAKATEKIENLKITAKVNKDNYYLKSANVSFDLSTENLSLPNVAETTLPITGPIVFNINISTELSNYNKQVVIVPPENAINIEETVKEIQSKYEDSLMQQELTLPQESTPSPQLKPGDDQQQTNIRDLLAPNQTVLGQKTNWELQTLHLFTQLFK